MTKYFLIYLLTALCFTVFHRILKRLVDKRTHPDYLFMISISAFRLTFILSLYILTIGFSLDMFLNILHLNYSDLNLLLNTDHAMEYLICSGLVVLMISLTMPFFFIKQIKITNDCVSVDEIAVSWSLKKFSNKKEFICYIQIHTIKRKGLYMIMNINQLSGIFKKEISINASCIPSVRQEKKLIDILNNRKKDSTFKFLSHNLIIAIVITISTMSLSIIVA